jgi:hypothetical protein
MHQCGPNGCPKFVQKIRRLRPVPVVLPELLKKASKAIADSKTDY